MNIGCPPENVICAEVTSRSGGTFRIPLTTKEPTLSAGSRNLEGEGERLRAGCSGARPAEAEDAIDSVESDREGGAETGREDASQRIGLQR